MRTLEQLETAVKALNQDQDRPTEYMTHGIINVGHLSLDINEIGLHLAETVNDAGGETNITPKIKRTKRRK